MPLYEKVRIEILVPDLPDPTYGRLLEELGNELSYSFGGCTVNPAMGKYRSTTGLILPDKVNILFTDIPFQWEQDRNMIEGYAEALRGVVRSALEQEEAILIAVYPVHHVD